MENFQIFFGQLCYARNRDGIRIFATDLNELSVSVVLQFLYFLKLKRDEVVK